MLFALGAGACYHPRPAGEQSCAVTCGPNGECPPGMTCTTGHVCIGNDVSSCSGVDASPPGDTGGGGGSDGGSGSGSAACTGSPDGHYGSGQMLQVTLSSPVMTQLALTSDVDTDLASCLSGVTLTPSPSTPVCVLAAQTITITGTVRVTGSKPLVLVADQALTIASGAALDLVGNRVVDATTTGQAAGAGTGVCATQDSDNGDPAGGGPGGSFATKGGDGGSPGPDAAGSIGAAFQGGCNGGDGGDNSTSNATGGKGGGGGGAIYLFAGCSIEIDGTVNASGAGGSGGGQGTPGSGPPQNNPPERGAGGGGGGAGGFIGIDAPSVTVHGTLLANGGGGGEAGDPDHAGAMGQTPPSSPIPTSPATGGSSQSAGGDGGNGWGLNGSGQGVSATIGRTVRNLMGQIVESGGGGGGGAGAIYIDAKTTPDTSAATISPPAAP